MPAGRRGRLPVRLRRLEGSVTGRITHEGEPLADVKVVMVGEGGQAATATTGADGTFTSVTTESAGDGAEPGVYQVGVVPIEEVDENPTSADAYAAPPPPPFPKKYMNGRTSGLEVTVEPGMAPVELDLKDS